MGGSADGAGVGRFTFRTGAGQGRRLPLVPRVRDAIARFSAIEAGLPVRGPVAVPVPAEGVARRLDALCLRIAAHGAAVPQRARFHAGRVFKNDPFAVCMPERGDLLRVAVTAYEADARLFARLCAIRFARARPFATGVRGTFGRRVALVADLPVFRFILRPCHKVMFVVCIRVARAHDEQHAQRDDDCRRDRQCDGDPSH